MKQWLFNLKLVLLSPRDILIGLFFAWWIGRVIEHFTDRALFIGNYGATHACINLTLDIINIVLLWLFVASFAYKWFTFQTVQTNNWGRIGSILTAIVSGCSSCSITLATYLWLASILAFLPFGGTEVKVLGTLLIIWSVVKNIKDLTLCKIR